MPNLSYKGIMETIARSSEIIDKNVNIVVLIGNSFNVNKSDLIKSFEMLQNLKANKVILCAFPFVKNASNLVNDRIHMLNTLLYNMTCRHSDAFSFFDCNKFTDKIFLTEDSMYLHHTYKIRLATLLAYNIDLLSSPTLGRVDKSTHLLSTNSRGNSLN